MSQSQQAQRYRVNPVEIIILLAVMGGFSLSVYKLFKQSGDMQFSALQTMNQKPNESVAEATRIPVIPTEPERKPASF